MINVNAGKITAMLLAATLLSLPASANTEANDSVGDESASASQTSSPRGVRVGRELLDGDEVFARYGIDKEIPKYGISSLSQWQNLLEHGVRVQTSAEGSKTSEFFMIQTTDDVGNIDLRIKYHPNRIEEDGNIVDRIEDITKTEYLLKSYSQSYDPKSVEVYSLGDERYDIHFQYANYGLPQNIAYFRFMRVVLSVDNGEATQMVITNSRPFLYEDGFMVDDYEQTIQFTRLENGMTVIKEKRTIADGRRNGEDYQLDSTIKPVAFYTSDDEVLVVNEELLQRASDPRMREEKVNLNRALPFMADLVRRQGIDVPLPYGVSAAYRYQSMDLGFTDFNIMDVNLNEYFDPGQSFGVVDATITTVRGDVNILPFWNVYGYIGRIDIDANVDAQYTGAIGDKLEEELGRVQAGIVCRYAASKGADVCTPGRLNVPVPLTYNSAGIGTTLSVGYRQYFASVTATYSKTKRVGGDKWGTGLWTYQPMVGYQLLDWRAQIFVGAEKQAISLTMDGDLGYIRELDRNFTYDVGILTDRWAYLVGFNKQIGKHFNVTGLYNRGSDRESFTVNFGYRW